MNKTEPKFKASDHVEVIAGNFQGRSGTVQGSQEVTHQGKVISHQYQLNLSEKGSAGNMVTLDEAELRSK